MSHYYEKNIVEIKNEYTEFLINILTPLLFEGIKSIYDKAVSFEEVYRQKEQLDPSIKNPGVFKLFQICLRDIPNLNAASIESETNRIKERSKCSEWFDSLLKSVIKSHIVLLTFNSKNKKSKIVEERYHEKIDTNLFIHKCYIESSRIFFNYPELFWHHFSTLDIKRNQREIYDLIKDAIKEAIKKTLPIKLIMEEYLKNDYTYEDDINSDKYVKVKNLINNENNRNSYEESIGGGLSDETSESYETSTSESNKKILGVNKMLDSDEQEIIEEEMNNIIQDVKESEQIENENNLLASHISNSVSINNLILNTSIEENENNIKEQDIKLVGLRDSGKKKNESMFFKEELSRYKLTKPVQKIDPEINLKINKTVSSQNNNIETDKNIFFEKMLN